MVAVHRIWDLGENGRGNRRWTRIASDRTRRRKFANGVADTNSGGIAESIRSPGEEGIVGSGEKSLTDAPFDDPRLAEEAPRNAASDRIQSLVGDRGLAGFAGTQVDRQSNSLVLFWKGHVPPGSFKLDLAASSSGSGCNQVRAVLRYRAGQGGAADHRVECDNWGDCNRRRPAL
jgi:hypothetical protein